MMIRILQIVTNMNRGGLETMIMNYYRNIDRTKIQFDFLVHRTEEGAYDKEIQELGGKIYHVSRLIPWSRRYKKELCDFFEQHPEYKIVHVHQDCLSSVALQCAKKSNVPVRIAHSHNSSQDKNIKYLIKLFYRNSIPKYATGLLACGKAAGDWMFCGAEYKVLPNAIDLNKYEYQKNVEQKVRSELRLENKFVLGHVGRFHKVKNHDFLIDIFAKCYEKNKDARLLLVGDGIEREHIIDKVKQLGLQEVVQLLGVRDDVNQLLQAMDVFVFPSLYEGLPVTLVEAQATGLPCVISDTISDECILEKSLVTYHSLEEHVEEWAETVLNCSKLKRMNCSEKIQEAGYDIVEGAKMLQEYYLARWEY